MRGLHILLGFILLSGCVPKKMKNQEERLLFTTDNKFTLKGDLNATEVPSLEELISLEGLDVLVHQGLAKNPHWRTQVAKLKMVTVQSGLLLSDSKPSLNANLGRLEGKEKTRESDFKEKPIPNWQAGMLLNWELDLLGKWKLVEESTVLHVKEAEYLQESAKISFIHEIAENWILLSALLERMQILDKAISSQKTSMAFYKNRSDAGLDDNTTYARQSVAYNQLLLDQARLLRQIEITKIRLRSLIGNPLESELPEISNLSEIQIPILPEVFPTAALKRRPDLMAKEAKLRESLLLQTKSAYDLYPSLAFQMSGLSLSSDLSKPFDQWKASFGPILNIPIWDPGRKIALKTAEAKSEVHAQEWQAAVNLAIEEIESATKSFLMSQKEYRLAQKSSQETSLILKRTKEKLQAGLVSQLELLEDERQFLISNMMELDARLQVFIFALNLSKALSLRWE